MKKILSVILAVCMLMTFAFAAYGEHEHVLMKMANLNCHYEECTICYELFNVGDHTFENGKCTVCGHDEYKNPFADVAPNAWYYDDVATAVDMGLVNGKAPDKYAPDDFITYAETIKLAACMNEYYVNKKVTLQNGTPWYQTYVDYCMEKDIISKFANYNYTAVATREEFLKIFAHALPEEEFVPINNVPNDSIPDYHSANMYAKEIYMLYRAGILAGINEKHELNPKANIKRSEVAAIITRMMDKSKRQRFDMSGSSGSISNNGTINNDADENNKTPATENTTTDNQNTPTDSGNASTDNQNTSTDNGNTSTDNGNTSADNQNAPSDSKKFPADKKVEAPNNTDTSKDESTIVITPAQTDVKGSGDLLIDTTKYPVEIKTQPQSVEAEGYSAPGTLTVEAESGTGRYTYQWRSRDKSGTYDLVDTENVKGTQTNKLIVYANPNDKHTGLTVYCTVTDVNGTTVNSNTAAVYGPFSMKVESYSIAGTNKYTIVGRLSDGLLRRGDKVAVERNGKIIAIGTVEDIQMFNKSLDEANKDDRVGITFSKTEGYAPASGDTVLRYQDYFKVDGSDIVN